MIETTKKAMVLDGVDPDVIELRSVERAVWPFDDGCLGVPHVPTSDATPRGVIVDLFPCDILYPGTVAGYRITFYAKSRDWVWHTGTVRGITRVD